MKQSFDNLAQRIIYGYKSFFSDFQHTVSDKVTEDGQREFHDLLKNIINIIYENPEALKLPIVSDSYGTAGIREYKKEHIAISKGLHDFFNFMYEIGICGIIGDDEQLTVQLQQLKDKKIVAREQYFDLLSQVGIDYVKSKEKIILKYNNLEIFNAWILLSQVSCGKFLFVLGAFNGKYDFLFKKIEKFTGLDDGYLVKCEEKALSMGYNKTINADLGNTELHFRISYTKEICGFSIGYSTRGGSINFRSDTNRGFKAMLKDFGNFEEDIQAHIVGTGKKCKNCKACEKKGKLVSAINVTYNENDLVICSDWPSNKIDLNKIDFHLKFFDLQDRYATT